MVSRAHEVLVDLFKNRPSLGAELLTEALGVLLRGAPHLVALTKIQPTVLSAMAHGAGDHGAAIAAAALPAVAGLGDDRFYGDLVLNSLNDAARRALEAMMKGYEYQSEFAKKYIAQGRQEGEARALLAALRVRGISVSDAARERILAEKAPERLERWVERAVVATSLAEVFDDPS